MSIYENFNYLGRSIIDKLVIMSGSQHSFTINHEGGKHLDEMVAAGKGGLLVSAHIGNWEAAGQLLERLKTKINIVMYEQDLIQLQQLLSKVRKRSFKVILINEDMSHVYEINQALQANEFVCIHADRFVEGNKTIQGNLLNASATFPLGPFILATSFEAPVSFVFAMKEGIKHFHFYASAAKIYPKGRAGISLMLEDYLRKIEVMIKRYPLQWHNYFPFWDEEKTLNQ